MFAEIVAEYQGHTRDIAVRTWIDEDNENEPMVRLEIDTASDNTRTVDMPADQALQLSLILRAATEFVD